MPSRRNATRKRKASSDLQMQGQKRQRRSTRTDLSVLPPTRPQTVAPTYELFRPPIFPSSKRINGQVYYDVALGTSMPGNGNAATYFFSANGMFDPDITGTGHQPMGFDQMMTFYEQVTVVRSSCTVRFLPSQPAIVGIALVPDTSTFNDPRKIIENGLVVHQFNAGLTSSSSALVTVPGVSLNCEVASYFGRRSEKELLEDVNLFTTAAANPVEQVYYCVFGWQFNPDGSTAKALEFDVQLSYDSVYWEPRKVALS